MTGSAKQSMEPRRRLDCFVASLLAMTEGLPYPLFFARIMASRLKELVITDSILPTEAVQKAPNIRTLPIAPLIAEAIARTASEESVSSLFD